MDRPSRPSEPIEPSDPGEPRLDPAPVDRQPDAEYDRRPEPAEDRVASEPVEPADERGRAEADRPAEARSSDDTGATSQETPDHLPADLREQMLRDPRFTRLGWGVEPGAEERHVAKETAKPVADAESDQSEETVTGARVAEQIEDESSGAATDAEDNGRDQTEEAADVSAPFSVDTEVDSEPVKSRFDRWDPERLAMARPPKPEVAEADDVQPDDRTEGDDRRAEDERNGVAYIAASKDTRPWLAPAAECEPIVQSVYASIDQSDGHGHIRHGAMGSDEMQARRVAFNEDPAQPDPEKRAQGVDGIDDSKQHYCGKDSTRVHDATALAAVYVMAAEHPEVRAVLDRPFDENVQPRDIAVPIAELLGPDGHEFCSGYTLKGWPEAKAARKEWLQVARAGGDLSEMAEPEVERIPTFEGGDIKIVFKRNLEAKRYGIYTLFPRPFEE